jgi:uncharacterized protein (TIGR00251 family)
VQFAVHVQPGARVAAVGGSRDEALLVKVRARAVDGKANDAVIAALAGAFDVRPRAVRLVHGATGRRKLVEIDVDEDQGAARLQRLSASS